MKKKEEISKKNKEDREENLKNPKDLYDKDQNQAKIPNVNQRYKCDLHGFTLSEANLKVKEIINKCFEKKIKQILLITGKGLHSSSDKNIYVSKNLSKLKFAVPEYINSQKELLEKIISIEAAKPEDGGEGAIIINLKKL